MNRLFPFVAAAGLAAMFTVFSPSANANQWDKRTTVSFSQAVEVPGAVLEPGSYVMKLLDSPSTRNIVQFTNVRENHVYATAIAINAYRAQVTDKTAISFYEAPSGQPEAMKTWFYPGDQYGQEFIYPKGHRSILASAAYSSTPQPDPVLSAIPEPSSSSSTLSNSTEPARPEAVNAAPEPVHSTPEPPVEIAQNTPPPPASSPVEIAQNNTPSTDSTLPKTASETYTLALIGLIAIGGAVALRKYTPSDAGDGGSTPMQ